MKKSTLLITITILIFFAFFAYSRFANQIDLPRGNSEKETIVIQDGEAIGTIDEVSDDVKDMLEDVEDLKDDEDEILRSAQDDSKKSSITTKEIMVTDGVKHSIPLNEIRGGGPPKDGIPSIDNPEYISVQSASENLSDDEIGLAVSIDGVNRFYPFQILVFHEIVNDTIKGQRVLVTYCPLCLTGIVFDPVVQGERVEFGTSGKLWNSNLIMYDRKTDSLWSQVLGEAVVGEMTGTKLKIVPSDVVKFGEWKKQFPQGEVLSQKTGARRTYGEDPYGDYYTSPGVYFPVNNTDERLFEKDIVLGIEFDGKAKAYHIDAVQKAGQVEDTFSGRKFVVKYEEEIGAVRVYEKKDDGTLKRINPVYGFWFSWVSVHPETEVYK